jgi:hypothetical protein
VNPGDVGKPAIVYNQNYPRTREAMIERNSHTRARVTMRVKVAIVDIYLKQCRARAAMLPSIFNFVFPCIIV